MFLLSILDAEPQLDAMPVIKTTHYPWAQDAFKPLAYARIAAVRGRGIFCDLQCFQRDPDCMDETDPLNNSCVALSFDFSPDIRQNHVFTIALDADGRYRSFLNEEPLETEIDVKTQRSRDELGFYWSVRFYISEKLLNLHFSVAKISNGHRIKGNIYKFQRTGSRSHMGAAAPMTSESIFAPENLADFMAVGY